MMMAALCRGSIEAGLNADACLRLGAANQCLQLNRADHVSLAASDQKEASRPRRVRLEVPVWPQTALCYLH